MLCSERSIMQKLIATCNRSKQQGNCVGNICSSCSHPLVWIINVSVPELPAITVDYYLHLSYTTEMILVSLYVFLHINMHTVYKLILKNQSCLQCDHCIYSNLQHTSPLSPPPFPVSRRWTASSSPVSSIVFVSFLASIPFSPVSVPPTVSTLGIIPIATTAIISLPSVRVCKK